MQEVFLCVMFIRRPPLLIQRVALISKPRTDVNNLFIYDLDERIKPKS